MKVTFGTEATEDVYTAGPEGAAGLIADGAAAAGVAAGATPGHSAAAALHAIRMKRFDVGVMLVLELLSACIAA